MGAKNSCPNKENEGTKTEAAPTRNHEYTEIDESFLEQNREEKKKINGSNVDSPLDSKESRDNTTASNTSAKARAHPYDEVVLDAENTEDKNSQNDATQQKDIIKIDTKVKEKKAKKKGKKEGKTEQEDKTKADKEMSKEILRENHETDSEDTLYSNISVLKKAEVMNEDTPTEGGYIYAQPMKTKEKDKPLTLKSTESQPVKQLNYIEVEITAKPRPATAAKPKSPNTHESTSYSNVIRENGRIVLVPEQ